MNRLLVAVALGAAAPAPAAPAPLAGFTTDHAETHRALERRFDAQLDRAALRDWMKRLSERPHHVGSAQGKAVADFLAGQFRSWGFDTQIEEFQVLFPTPRTRLLELVAPTRARAVLAEPVLREDATSGQTREQLPTYNAYSADGDVEGALVYVNYGLPRDYEQLERRGIDVRGKIVIARYGESWRGIKPKVAAEHGAVGCLIYSDPRDDGYGQGEPYPKGAWRGEWGAQRGSVMDLPTHTGDPLTPGVGATRDARRLDRAQAATLAKIPVLPISWGDALPLLRGLDGAVAPSGWRGGLPITYHIGPGPARVHLKLAFDWKLVPAYDVVARLTGRERPGQWIVRGNHHDAWVNGAEDPISGLIALMAEARAVGALARGGWRPRRTMVYAAWDAEEQGMIGATEWAEAHADELRQHAVAYVNSDGNGRGFLEAAGSHTLEPLVNDVAREVTDPQRGISVAQRLRAVRMVEGNADEKRELREGSGFHIGALGSGSDWTPFLQHLGVAALSVGFGGENQGGSYHSIYDSFDHYSRFGDPGFAYGVVLAQVAGRVVLRLAEADLLPFAPGAFADAVARYLAEVRKLTDDMRTETEEHNRLVRDGAFAAAADPQARYVPPAAKTPVPHLNFAPLLNAVARLQASARAWSDAVAAGPPASAPRVDELLLGLERQLLRPEGLPLRPWYKHQVYAPGFYTGYGVKTLPGVREAIEERQWPRAETQIAAAAAALEAFAARVEQAAALARGTGATAGK
jgi:N-acetylated-alpha-linked acidic dipeptidase